MIWSDYANAVDLGREIALSGFQTFAVLAAMAPNPSHEHVVGHGSTRHAMLRRKSKAGFTVDKVAISQADAHDRRPVLVLSPTPYPCIFGFGLGGRAPPTWRVRPGSPLEQFLNALL